MTVIIPFFEIEQADMLQNEFVEQRSQHQDRSQHPRTQRPRPHREIHTRRRFPQTSRQRLHATVKYITPYIQTDTSIKVYVLTDPILIDFAQDGDIEDFKEYLDSDDTIYFNDPETFDTEAEALAYCAGIGYASPERGPVERYPLRSSEPEDTLFIKTIENY